MQSFLVLACILLLSACSSAPGLYAEVGIGYQLDSRTDYWLQTDRDWQCKKQPQFHGEVGYEFPHDLRLGYHHQSWWRCGGPFNERPEIYTDDLRLTKKWGGL